MNIVRGRLSSFTTFACLSTGLALGFILICSDWEIDFHTLPSEAARSEEAATAATTPRDAVGELFFAEAGLEDASGGLERVTSLNTRTLDELRDEEQGAAADDEGEELPNPNVIEDGQDQSPEDKERKARAREAALAASAAEAADSDARQGEAGTEAEGVGQAATGTAIGAAVVGSGAERLVEREAHVEGVSGERSTGEQTQVATKATGKRSTSIAALAEDLAKDKLDAEEEPLEKGVDSLSAAEQKFLFQMTDMLAVGNAFSDRGGQRIQMKFLTEDEADAQDEVEYSSKQAYGAREEDLVTFLQVQQGMPVIPRDELVPKLKAAAEGVPLLSVDIVRAHAWRGLIFVTYANWAYYDFALNWVGHMRRIGVTNFLVGALDRQTSLGLAALDIPGFQMYTGTKGVSAVSTQDFSSAYQQLRLIGSQKIALARLFTDSGYDIVLSDVDTVWLRDPTPFIARAPEADVLVASNDLNTGLGVGDQGLEVVQAIQGSLSLSVLVMRHTSAVSNFVKAWDELMLSRSDLLDQDAFSALVAELTTPLSALVSNPRIATGPAQKIKAGVLPVSHFMNGHTFFEQRLHEVRGVEPFCVHANYNEGGRRGKRHRLREASLWNDPPSYFDVPSGFVQVVFEPPSEPYRSLSEADMLRFHAKNLDEQLRQVRAGAGIAIALDRTLIMPRLKCFCDRLSAGRGICRPSGVERRPFDCPLDHVLDLARLDDAPGQNGPRLDIREHNFLERSRRPAVMADSLVVVSPADSVFSGLVEPSLPRVADTVHVEPGLPAAALRERLADQAAVRVLVFTDAVRTFGGFDRSGVGVTAAAARLARLGPPLGGAWAGLLASASN